MINAHITCLTLNGRQNLMAGRETNIQTNKKYLKRIKQLTNSKTKQPDVSTGIRGHVFDYWTSGRIDQSRALFTGLSSLADTLD